MSTLRLYELSQLILDLVPDSIALHLFFFHFCIFTLLALGLGLLLTILVGLLPGGLGGDGSFGDGSFFVVDLEGCRVLLGLSATRLLGGGGGFALGGLLLR